MGRQRAIPTGEGWMTVVRQHKNKLANNYQPSTRSYSNNNRVKERQVLHQMSTPNWSELPNDVLGYLISFLCIPDYYRFGAVCRNWCTVAREKHHRPVQQLPWLVLGEHIFTKKRIFFNLSDNKHYYIDIPKLQGQFVCGSSFGWLFSVDITLNIRMLNPFTQECYNLPSLDFNNKDVFKGHHHDIVYKVILDHDPSESSDFMVMVIDGYYQTVAFWRRGDLTWTLPICQYDVVLNDIIYFKGKFYAVGYICSHKIFVVDVGPNPKLIPLQHQVPMIGKTCKFFIIDLKGELLLLQRYKEETMLPNATTNVVVHKLDFEEGIYSECKDINSQAFFIGNNSPIVIDPIQLSGCTPNDIYFAHATYRIGRNDLETYNIVTKCSAIYYPFNTLFSFDVAPTWLATNP
ncbi:F-box/kelch-repeat protein At1g57790-like [Carex rostrata]